jgi:hypothetical protein
VQPQDNQTQRTEEDVVNLIEVSRRGYLCGHLRQATQGVARRHPLSFFTSMSSRRLLRRAFPAVLAPGAGLGPDRSSPPGTCSAPPRPCQIPGAGSAAAGERRSVVNATLLMRVQAVLLQIAPNPPLEPSEHSV